MPRQCKVFHAPRNITKDSTVFVINDSILQKTDSCYIDSSNTAFKIFSNLVLIYLNGDTLVTMSTIMLGAPDYRYVRIGNSTLFRNECRQTRITQFQHGKPFIVNLLGQKEMKSNVTNLLINSNSNKTFINLKK